MALTATQRSFLTKLGVKPKNAFLDLFGQKKAKANQQITSEFDKYLLLEKELIAAIKQLESLPVTPARIASLENEVESIQVQVSGVKRETGAEVFKQAYQSLDAIKPRVATLKGQAERYRDELKQARSRHALLVHKVVQVDALAIKTDFIDAAVVQGDQDKHEQACSLLAKVEAECLRVQGLADDYDKYLLLEKELIAAIKQLESLPVTPARIASLENEVEQVQARVSGAKRETGSEVLKQAYQSLDAIKLRVATLKGQAERYRDELKQARSRHALLVHKVVQVDALAIKTDFIDAAVVQGDQDKHEPACSLLAKVEAECLRVQGLADDYDKAFNKAKTDLKNSRASMLALDVEKVQKEMLDAAADKADQGERQAALELIAKVAPHCRISRRANLKALVDTYSWNFESLTKPLVDLKAHGQHAEFAKEIASLSSRLENLRQIAAAGLTTFTTNAEGKKVESVTSNEAVLLYEEATKQLEFANEHASYVVELAKVTNLVKPLLDKSDQSNAAIRPEIDALEQGLAKAGRQAGKRHYDLAQATLDKLARDRTAANARKQAHAEYLKEFASLELRVKACPDVAGTPGEAEAKALRVLLAQAQAAAAEPGRDYDGARKLLAKLSQDCDAIDRFEAAAKQDGEDLKAMTRLLDSDLAAALAEAKKQLEALKKRAGHEGITPQLKEIGTLIEQADKALNV